MEKCCPFPHPNLPGVTIVRTLKTLCICKDCAFALEASPNKVKVGKTAGFTLLCSPLQGVAGESRVEHLGMGKEKKYLILLPGVFMKNGDLIFH